MRAGDLRDRAELSELGPDLRKRVIKMLWIGLRTEDNASPGMPVGLRNPIRVDIRARYSPDLITGRYLTAGERLLHITSVRDPVGNRAELRITADELIGLPGVCSRDGHLPLTCRIFIKHGVSRPGELTGRAEYTTQLEAAVIEVGRPQPGAVFQLAGEAWRVVGLVDEEDDGVTRRMWVKPA